MPFSCGAGDKPSKLPRYLASASNLSLESWQLKWLTENATLSVDG